MPKALVGVNWQLIQALYMAGVRPGAISAQTGVKMVTICARANRSGWKAALQTHTYNMEMGNCGLQSRSLALRETFADELAKSATALGKVPYKSNLRELKKRAEVLEPLARTAKVVFDWGSEKPNGLIVMGNMRQAEAIDLPTNPEPPTALPALNDPEPTKEIPLPTEPDPEPTGQPL